MDVKIYHEITTDVWKIFKKYHPTDAKLDTFTADVHTLDEKYKEDPERDFMKRLLKVYFDELRSIKG